MKRYALYRGVPGVLVAHPFAGAAGHPEHGLVRTGRYAGKRLMKPADLAEKFGTERPTLAECELADRYADVDEVLQLDPALTKAVASGALKQCCAFIEAKSLADAQAKLLAEPKAKTQPKTEPKAGDK